MVLCFGFVAETVLIKYFCLAVTEECLHHLNTQSCLFSHTTPLQLGGQEWARKQEWILLVTTADPCWPKRCFIQSKNYLWKHKIDKEEKGWLPKVAIVCRKNWLDTGFFCSMVTVLLCCAFHHTHLLAVFVLAHEFSDFCFCYFLPISHWDGGEKVNCPVQTETNSREVLKISLYYYSFGFATTHSLCYYFFAFALQKIFQSSLYKCFHPISWKSKNLSCYIALCSGPLK